MKRGPARLAVLFTGVAGVLVLGAACTSQPTAAPATGTPTTSAATHETGSGAVPAAAALKFPNTDDDVVFVGFDTRTGLAQFQKIVQDPNAHAEHLIPDPRDPAKHQLPVAKNATVTSIDPTGFPFETCPQGSCPPDTVLASVISHDNGAFYAHIHVNGTDQITLARELAY